MELETRICKSETLESSAQKDLGNVVCRNAHAKRWSPSEGVFLPCQKTCQRTDLTQQSEVWDFFNAVSGAVHGHSCPSRQTRSAVMVVSGSVHSKIVARKGSHGSLKTSHER